MVVVMRPGATPEQIEQVIDRLHADGFETHRSDGEGQTVIGVVGDTRRAEEHAYKGLTGVGDVLRITEPYKLASRVFRSSNTTIDLGGGVVLGGREVLLMAGPCTIENKDTVDELALAVKKAGAKVMRGGAFKPRTSPYAFQGIGEPGLRWIRDAADAHGLKVISEVMDASQIAMMSDYVDILQVGARNCQNFNFLKTLGKISKPVLLKRGFANTYQELLLSAEYIMSGGNHQVILCERGIRTFEPSTRNTLDLAAVPMLKSMSHLPVVVDPSHALGIRDKVPPLSIAAMAAGADGLLIEVHPRPELAFCDGAQSLLPNMLVDLSRRLARVAPVVDRDFPFVG